MEKKIVDARGLACPLPVVNAKKAAEEAAQQPQQEPPLQFDGFRVTDKDASPSSEASGR